MYFHGDKFVFGEGFVREFAREVGEGAVVGLVAAGASGEGFETGYGLGGGWGERDVDALVEVVEVDTEGLQGVVGAEVGGKDVSVSIGKFVWGYGDNR